MASEERGKAESGKLSGCVGAVAEGLAVLAAEVEEVLELGKILVFEGGADGVESVFEGAEGADDLLAVVLADFAPEVGAPGGDAGGVAEPIPRKGGPRGGLGAEGEAEGGRREVGHVADVCDNLVVGLRREGGDLHREGTPKGDEALDGGGRRLRKGRDKNRAAGEEVGAGVGHPGALGARHRVGTEKSDLGREGSAGLAANEAFGAPDIGHEAAGSEVRGNAREEGHNRADGGAENNEVGFRDGLGRGLGGGVAPRLFAAGGAGFGAAGPSDDAFGEALPGDGLAEGGSEEAGGEDGDLRKHEGEAKSGRKVRGRNTLFNLGGMLLADKSISIAAMPTKPARSSRRNRRSGWRRLLAPLGFTLLIGCFLALMIWLARAGSDRSPVEFSEDVLTTAELEALEADSLRYESQFRAIAEGRPLTWEDLELLDLAVDRQRAYQRGLGTEVVPGEVLTRLAELIALRDSSAGGLLRSRSEALTEESRRFSREGRFAEATTRIEEAIALQERVNNEYARGEHANRTRLLELRMERDQLVVRPLVRRLESLRQDADLAFARGDFAEATAKREEALGLARRLLSEFSNTRAVRREEVVELERALLDTRAGQSFEAVRALEAKAAAESADGEYEAAAQTLAQAQEAFRNFRRDFPRSEFATGARASALESLRQTALSAPLAHQMRALEASLLAALRERRTEAAQALVADLWGAIDTLHQRYKESAHRDEGLLLRVRFLNLQRDQLGAIQAAAWKAARTLPTSPGVWLSATETPQELYRSVMGTNPSSARDPLQPVESVTWTEAVEFCQRLGWILGLEVSLPTTAIHREALGAVAADRLDAEAWHLGNAEREARAVGTRAANAHGFYDLLGNVAEWLAEENPRDGREAKVVGGSARVSLEALAEVPEGFRNKETRERFLGFRWMVQAAAGDAVELEAAS